VISANGTILAVKAGFNRASFGVERSGHVRVFRLSSPDCISSDPIEPFDYELTSQDFSTGAIVGLVLAAVVAVGVISFFYLRKVRKSSSGEESDTSPASPGRDDGQVRDEIQSPGLPLYKDQVRSPVPKELPAWARPEEEASNADLLQYKDQVRHVHQGNLPSTVIAQPESEEALGSVGEDEDEQPATATVLNNSDSQNMSASKAKDVDGGAIPVALAVFLDNDEKKPRAKLKSIEEEGGEVNTNSLSRISESAGESVEEDEEKTENDEAKDVSGSDAEDSGEAIVAGRRMKAGRKPDAPGTKLQARQ